MFLVSFLSFFFFIVTHHYRHLFFKPMMHRFISSRCHYLCRVSLNFFSLVSQFSSLLIASRRRQRQELLVSWPYYFHHSHHSLRPFPQRRVFENFLFAGTVCLLTTPRPLCYSYANTLYYFLGLPVILEGSESIPPPLSCMRLLVRFTAVLYLC